MATLTLSHVNKIYKTTGQQVIFDVSAQVNEAEFIVIVGPSGCGKSSLLRMVAGLEDVSSGEISIDDKVVNHLEPSARDIAMVFQNYALYPHYTVFNNMAYGLKIKKLPKAEILRRVHAAAEILELTQFLQRKPRELSGGQRQRVAMGRAIVRQPKLFLFDEPLSNLDAKLRAQTRLEIQKLHRDFGVTSLFVTHDQVEAMTLAQRMIVINAGRIEQIDTPDEVYRQPATTFVASFIGAPPMNLLHNSPLTGHDSNQILGVRPEHFIPVAATTSGAWTVRVISIERLGAERLLHCALPSTNQKIIVRVSEMDNSSALSANINDTLSVTPHPQHLHWFDAATGLRCSH